MKNIELGDRYNQDKLKFSLVPPKALKELAKVLQYGAVKYSPNQWKKGLKFSETIDSLYRHLESFREGEDVDPESKCLHLGHILANTSFLIEFYLTNTGIDDRLQEPDKTTTNTKLLNVEQTRAEAEVNQRLHITRREDQERPKLVDESF